MTARHLRSWCWLAALLVLVSGLAVGARPAAAQGESILGEVVDEDDEPVEGVSFTVTTSEGAEVGTVETDADGRWEVPVPGAATYVVTVDPESFPDGVGLRNPDRTSLDNVSVRPGQAKRVVFPVGPAAEGISDTERFATLAVDGVRIGLVLALMSVGLSLVFGVTGLVNFAHGELVTFGALVAFFFSTPSGVDLALPVAAALAFAAGGAFGYANDALLFEPLRRRRTGNVALIVVTIGLSLVLRHVYLVIYGGRPRPYDQYTIQRGLDWPLISPRPKDLAVIAVAAVALAGYALLISRTRLGTATRAVADSRDLAEVSGIDVRSVTRTTWIIAGALAALGGVLWGVTETIVWDMGFALLLLMFATVILGGIGTAYGPILAGLVIGVAAQLTTFWIDPRFRTAVALAVLIVVILIRPQGILGRAERVG